MVAGPGRVHETPAGVDAEQSQPVPVTPGLSERLIATHHIRVGDAAMALDPLRGDGSGFALRGALLAQAVIAAINAGLAREACFEHYEQRLQNVFLSHLRGCSAHYRTARYASIWEHDIAAMDCLAATVGLKQKLPVLGLQGFNLVPLGHHRLAAKRPSVS